MEFTHNFATESLGLGYFQIGTYDFNSDGLRMITDPNIVPYVCKLFYPLEGFPEGLATITASVRFGPNIESYLLGFKTYYNNNMSVQVVKLEWKDGNGPVNKIRTIGVNGPPHEWVDLCDLPTLNRDGTTEYLLSSWFSPSTYATRRVYIDKTLLWQGNVVQIPSPVAMPNSIQVKSNVEDGLPTNSRWARIKNFTVNW
ncbi:hypothetical protein M0R04_10635 [Candidatus Dojkabacteria bacterium]|jgi:hypothetical protein|nr:hypothetical protein [Candidatus Dojkabacteria bacterium]